MNLSVAVGANDNTFSDLCFDFLLAVCPNHVSNRILFFFWIQMVEVKATPFFLATLTAKQNVFEPLREPRLFLLMAFIRLVHILLLVGLVVGPKVSVVVISISRHTYYSSGTAFRIHLIF